MKNMRFVIKACVDGIKESTDEVEKRIIKASLNNLLRKWCDAHTVLFVSEKAKIEADKIGINLFEKQWHSQTKFDKDRKVFHLEHKYPIADMIVDMLKNPDNIDNILDAADFGWVLKEEDNLLPSHNRGDHDKVYEDLGIKLVRNTL